MRNYFLEIAGKRTFLFLLSSLILFLLSFNTFPENEGEKGAEPLNIHDFVDYDPGPAVKEEEESNLWKEIRHDLELIFQMEQKLRKEKLQIKYPWDLPALPLGPWGAPAPNPIFWFRAQKFMKKYDISLHDLKNFLDDIKNDPDRFFPLDNNRFCGEACHNVMAPEYQSHQDKGSRHRHAHCEKCHVGGKLKYILEQKARGLDQLEQYLKKEYDRPIEVPLHDLRPPGAMCLESCHNEIAWRGDRDKIRVRFGRERDNGPYILSRFKRFLGKTIGSGEGVHRHVAEDFKVFYKSKDNGREDITWLMVRYRDKDSKKWVTKEWLREGYGEDHRPRNQIVDFLGKLFEDSATKGGNTGNRNGDSYPASFVLNSLSKSTSFLPEISQGPGFTPDVIGIMDALKGFAYSDVRIMDCTDCHNRIGHPFLSKDEALDRAFSRGFINWKIPYIKYEALKAFESAENHAGADQKLETESEIKVQALIRIAESLRSFYKDKPNILSSFGAQNAGRTLDSIMGDVERILAPMPEDDLYKHRFNLEKLIDELGNVLESRFGDIGEAVAEIMHIYNRNVDHHMGIDWDKTYLDHAGHDFIYGKGESSEPGDVVTGEVIEARNRQELKEGVRAGTINQKRGCFRCHYNDKLRPVTKDTERLSEENCLTCHQPLADGSPDVKRTREIDAEELSGVLEQWK